MQKKNSKPLDKIPISNQPSLKLIRIILVTAVLLVYGNSLHFSFTLDDDLFYLKHKSVQQGIAGIGELFSKGSLNQYDGTLGPQPYRPLTLTFFALQKTLFDNSSIAAHFMSLLLYTLVILSLHRVLTRLLTGIHAYVIALMTLLFIVHPIHTEVVASVKSSDELLAALFGLMAWDVFLNNSNERKTTVFIRASFYFFMALLSKESAIAFLVIIPLSMLMIRKEKTKASLRIFLSLLVPVVIFLGMRKVANHASGIPSTGIIIDNVLYGATSFSELTATKMEILFYYLRLMFWPWPLTCDYSYNQVPLVGWDNISAIAGVISYATLFVLSMVFFRKKSLLSFCILFFFIASAPVNNLFFVNGATIGERLLFVPSIAFCVIIPWALSELSHLDLKTFSSKSKNIFFGLLTLLIIIFGGMSYSRSQEWKDNFILFEKAVERSPNSARSHYYLASLYLESGRSAEIKSESDKFLADAISHYNKALDIYPNYKQALYNSGICYALVRDTANAIARYKRTIDADPKYIPAFNNLGVMYQSKGNTDSARYYFEKVLKISPTESIAKTNLGELYFYIGLNHQNKASADSAIIYYRRSLAYNDNNLYTYNNLGLIYIGKSQLDSAIHYLHDGYSKDNKSVMILENMAVANFLQKNYVDAILYAKKAFELQPRSKKALGILRESYSAMGNRTDAERYRQLLEAI